MDVPFQFHPSSSRVLIVSDNAADSSQILERLETEFPLTRVAAEPAPVLAETESFSPSVLLLAFRRLEDAERLAAELRHEQKANAFNRRCILLCNKDDVPVALELCKAGAFDDYVLYWPQAQDGLRLIMAVWNAALQVSTAARGPIASELTTHVGHLDAMQALLERSNRRLAALNELNVGLASERDPDAMLEKVCAGARELIGARGSVLAMESPAKAGATWIATSGLSEPEAERARAGIRFDVGLPHRAMLERLPRRFSNSGGDPTVAGLTAQYPSMHSGLLAPIVSLTRAYGWILIVDKIEAKAFSGEDERLLANLAAQAGRVYESGRLYRQAWEAASRLQAEVDERKAVNTKLRDSEERFQQLAEHIREVFFLEDPLRSRTLYVSPAYEEIFGRTRASLYADASSWKLAMHPDDREATVARINTSIVGNSFDVEYRIVRPDGAIRWIRARGFPIRDGAGSVYRVAGIAEDVTEQVRLREDLREREAALRRAQLLAKLGHLVTRPDGSFESWSESLPSLIGLAPSALPKTTREWTNMLPPEDRELFRRAAIAAGISGREYAIEYRWKRGDGTWMHVHQQVEPLPGAGAQRRWFSTFQDVTEQRRDEQRLRESERRYADMLDNIELVSMMLDRDARITYANDFLLRLSGWSREEVLGQSWFERFIGPDAGSLRGVFDPSLDSQPRSLQYNILTRSGERRLIQWNNSVLRASTGEVTGTASIGVDITEGRRAEEKILRLNQDLERRVVERTAQLQVSNHELALATTAADRANRAKSEFLANMSHELRTPLNAIIGFGQLLIVADDPKHTEYVEHIVKAGRHLLTLINEVLNLAQVEAGEVSMALARVPVAPVLAECRAMIEPLSAPRAIALDLSDSCEAAVLADPTRLKQVLLNLLSNAVKYNRDGGSVAVECSTPQAGRVRIAIHDTGVGLSPEQLASLFQTFNRLGREAGPIEGTGIGLVVTKRLVELMGGRIGVDSTPGVGSEFWVELRAHVPGSEPSPAPVRTEAGAREPEAAVDATMSRYTSPPTAGELATILCVDDDAFSLRLVQEVLRARKDLHVLSATNGRLAVDMARSHLPDVILMDHNLPELSGREALAILRNDVRTAHIPIIALSANALAVAREEGLAAGFFDYLTKPFEVPELMAVLDRALQVSTDGRS